MQEQQPCSKTQVDCAYNVWPSFPQILSSFGTKFDDVNRKLASCTDSIQQLQEKEIATRSKVTELGKNLVKVDEHMQGIEDKFTKEINGLYDGLSNLSNAHE